jgi:hypothetical protein
VELIKEQKTEANMHKKRYTVGSRALYIPFMKLSATTGTIWKNACLMYEINHLQPFRAVDLHIGTDEFQSAERMVYTRG